ncbi:MAG TPA: hypothetical protein VGD56_20910 [Gemmatirosa sp.]
MPVASACAMLSPAHARRARSALSASLAVAALAACGPSPDRRAAAWTLDTAAVLGPAAARTDSARVNLYVDATVSMSGYVADPNTRYAEFLEGLESAAQTTWRHADVHFYRFGADAHEVGRPAFLAAKAPPFYTEKITDIDRAVDCGPPNEVRVIVTDLFQSEGDVNAIVARIKDRCFQRGRAVAVLGATSQFRGKVFDAKVPTYVYTSTANPASYRPFYALLLGDVGALEPFLASLSARAGGARLPYVTVAPTVVRHYAVAMRKAPGTREFNPQTPIGPYEFSFVLLKNQRGGTVLADVVATAAPGAPPLRADELELVAYRRNVAGGAKARTDSSETPDVTLQHVTQGGDSLHLTLAVNPPGTPGTYAYKLVLRTPAAGGFSEPAWVTQYSSTNPTPAVDANKTLNLAEFVRDMRLAASSVTQPRVAVWYLTVRKL